MAIIKCKMCGGDLEVMAGVTVAECEYCGTRQTLPKADEEVIQNLFNRANVLRLKCEFDKAEQIYEKILQENNAEAEAHWGIVLCKYGIEYVEDPKTYKRIPTCHRTSYDAVTADADYLAAMEYADIAQRNLYEAEARAIDRIQKNILSIVKNEKPFDVFLCYKETDEYGKRTVDSTIANEIYYQLTQEGLKVFYAAITLEDKLGQEYEPYIFAALNSAKVMLAIGTKPQYFTAVWVKNEWSRFLKLMKTDRSRLLIPCYKDMDAYELPEEFAHLQAQNMAKIGFINDVVRGIKKVTVKDAPQPAVVKETVAISGNVNTAPLLERVFLFLEDGEWDRADDFCEQVLNIDPKCAQAYVGKLMAELRVRKQEQLQDCQTPFNERNNYQKILRFGDESLKATMAGYIEHINTRNDNVRLEEAYRVAKLQMTRATTEQEYTKAAVLFERIPTHQDAAEMAKKCRELAEKAYKDAILTAGKSRMEENTIPSLEQAIRILSRISGWKDAENLIIQCRQRIIELEEAAEIARKDAIYDIGVKNMRHPAETIENFNRAISEFKSIPGWKDADRLVSICRRKIEELKAKAEADRQEKERQAEIARQEQARIAKRNRITIAIVLPSMAVIIAFLILLFAVIIPYAKYNDSYMQALSLMDTGEYSSAIDILERLDEYKDSSQKIADCHTFILDEQYDNALALMKAEQYAEALLIFVELGSHKDSEEKMLECKYHYGIFLMNGQDYSKARALFESLGEYSDSANKAMECKYSIAVNLKDSGEIINAYEAFIALAEYKDSAQIARSMYNEYKERKFIEAVDRIKNANVGEYIHFGAYEQDDDLANGMEDIEWLILDKEDNRLLVISKYTLDCQPYQYSEDSIVSDVATWKTCSLRRWLNIVFLNTAFTKVEQKCIPAVTVPAQTNKFFWNTTAGEDTFDQIFLLSIAECEKYFSQPENSYSGWVSAESCYPTPYAIAQGAYVVEENGLCYWWLRSPGEKQTEAAYVYPAGFISDDASWGTNSDKHTVRPAMWIDLNALEQLP